MLAGKFELNLEPLDLWRVIELGIDVIPPEAETKGVTIDAVAPARPVTLTGDASRLQQVFWNLLSNSVKFTPAGGRVSIRTSLADNELAVIVSDNGSGINPEFLPHVFERFSQADTQKRPLSVANIASR